MVFTKYKMYTVNPLYQDLFMYLFILYNNNNVLLLVLLLLLFFLLLFYFATITVTITFQKHFQMNIQRLYI